MIEFNLKDQSGREYTERGWKGSNTAVIGSGKDGGSYDEIWSSTFLSEGYCTGKFLYDDENWVLMD